MLFEFTLGIQEIHEDAKVNHRKAVRAVVVKNNNIVLMVSSNKGDLKFPGGGVEVGENNEEALIREAKEETGYVIEKVKEKIGMVIERNIDIYENDSIFEMQSHYYICEVSESKGTQKLDDYEADLGFSPKWTDIDSAINNNENILKDENADINRWVNRETLVLRELKKALQSELIK